ncbi:hypothetical protein PG995_012149 [Apiospora arundinis]
MQPFTATRTLVLAIMALGVAVAAPVGNGTMTVVKERGICQYWAIYYACQNSCAEQVCEFDAFRWKCCKN